MIDNGWYWRYPLDINIQSGEIGTRYWFVVRQGSYIEDESHKEVARISSRSWRRSPNIRIRSDWRGCETVKKVLGQSEVVEKEIGEVEEEFWFKETSRYRARETFQRNEGDGGVRDVLDAGGLDYPSSAVDLRGWFGCAPQGWRGYREVQCNGRRNKSQSRRADKETW